MTDPERDAVWTHADLRRARLQRALAMTPSERLAWLETTLAELQPLLGRATRPFDGRQGTAPQGDTEDGSAR